MKEPGKYKILGIYDGGGSGYHRIQLPGEYLNGEKITINGEELTIEMSYLKIPMENKIITEDAFKNNDAIFFTWLMNNTPAQLSLWAKRHNCRIVMDIDDTWHFPPNHPYYTAEQRKIAEPSMIQYIFTADAITCTTSSLGGQIAQYNPIVSVSPNALPYGDKQFLNKSMEASDKITLSLVGSLSHYPDYMNLLGVFKRLAGDGEIRSKCKFLVGGVVKGDKNWDKVVKMVKNSHPQMEVEVIETKDVFNYMDIYDSCDILLAPLENNEFNEKKSSLKLAEAACKDIPVIGDKLYREKELNGLCVVENKPDWFKWVKYLIKDENYIKLGKKFGEVNRNALKFKDRIDNLKAVFEFVHSNRIDPKPSNLHVFGITYNNNQFTEYTQYDNSHIRTIEQRSYLYEWNPILDILDNKVENVKNDDYLGILSYKFPEKTGLSSKILYQLVRELTPQNADIINLTPTYKDLTNNYLNWTNFVQNGFLPLFGRLCNKLGLPTKEPKNVIFSGMFLAKKEVYVRFVQEIIKPAITIMEGEMYEDVMTDSNYKAGLPKEELKAITGLDFYPWPSFLLERLLSVWLDTQNYKVIQVL